MSKDSASTDPSADILEEASSWMIELEEGEIDPAQRAQFDQWLRRSPENVRAFLEISAAWEESFRLDAHGASSVQSLIAQSLAESNVIPLPTAMTAGRGHAAAPPASPSDGAAASESAGRSKPRRTVSRRAALAAALLAAVGATALWQTWQASLYITGTGEQRSIALADGSMVQLNSQSKLRVHFSNTERTVELIQGQAFFQVNKDAARPFVVRTGEANVRVVGTQFDVYRSRGGAIVTVVEGRVAVSPVSGDTEQKLYLAAGEQVTVGPAEAPHPVHANVATVTAWTERKLVFEGAALTQVVQEFNRYNVRRVVITDATLEEVHVRGTFAANNPQRLVEFLQQRFPLAIEETQDEIRIGLKR